MQKFTVHTISLFLMLINITVASAQSDTSSYKFDEFAALFLKNKIEPPTPSEELMKINLSIRPQIDCEMYNWFIICGQAEKAKRCSIDGKLFRAAYGLLSSEDYKVYALGYLQHDLYNIFITRIENIQGSFIDVFTYSTNGTVLSMLCLYENEPLFNDTVYIFSQILTNEKIHYVENRYGVNINIDYEMLNNGILKEQSVSKTGTYEIVDKDGYVNVREKPDINSKVLYTLKSGSVIIGHTENGSKWDEVLRVLDDEVVKEDLNKKGGYIHSSRLSNNW